MDVSLPTTVIGYCKGSNSLLSDRVGLIGLSVFTVSAEGLFNEAKGKYAAESYSLSLVIAPGESCILFSFRVLFSQFELVV